MKFPLVLLAGLALAGGAVAQRAKKMVVHVDGNDVSGALGSVYEFPNAYMAPASKLVSAVSNGGLDFRVAADGSGLIERNGKVVVKIGSGKAEVHTGQEVRNLEIPSSIEKLEDGTVVMDPALLGWLLGISIDYTQSGFDLYTPCF